MSLGAAESTQSLQFFSVKPVLIDCLRMNRTSRDGRGIHPSRPGERKPQTNYASSSGSSRPRTRSARRAATRPALSRSARSAPSSSDATQADSACASRRPSAAAAESSASKRRSPRFSTDAAMSRSVRAAATGSAAPRRLLTGLERRPRLVVRRGVPEQPSRPAQSSSSRFKGVTAPAPARRREEKFGAPSPGSKGGGCRRPGSAFSNLDRRRAGAGEPAARRRAVEQAPRGLPPQRPPPQRPRPRRSPGWHSRSPSTYFASVVAFASSPMASKSMDRP